MIEKHIIKIIILTMMITVFFINVEVKADNTEQVIETDYYKIDYEDSTISEIEPRTEIKTFKSKLYDKSNQDASDEELETFRSNIKIYQDRTCRIEVTKGNVGTGMAIRYNDEIYDLSIVGDINGDGDATQIEVTAIIRYVIGLPSTITEGVCEKSADFTLDGNINQIDITKVIRYIVFGEIDLGKVDEKALKFTVSSKGNTFINLSFNNTDKTQIRDIKVFLKKQNEDDTKYIEKQILEEKCELTELEDGIIYTIKVIAKDKKGHTIEKTIDVKTEKIPDATEEGAIIFSEVKWENKKAQIEISTKTEYQIEYQINSAEGKWTKAEKGIKLITIPDLSENDVIYARLADEHVSGEYTEKTIKDEIPPKIELTLTVNSHNSIRAEATITDDELGENDNPLYIFYIKKAEEPEEAYVEKKRTTGPRYTFSSLDPDTNYTIKMTTKDKAGNLGQKTGNAKTKKIIDLIDEGDYQNASFKFTNEKGTYPQKTNGYVLAKLELKNEDLKGYTIQTKKDDGEWENTDNQRLMSNSEKVYARLIDGEDYGEEITGQVSNIDTVPPVITEITATTKEIFITTSEDENLISGYNVARNTMLPSNFEEITTKSKKLENYKLPKNLEQGKDYYVWVQDEAGNISEYKKVTTEKVPNAVINENVIVDPLVWENRQASMGISTNTNYSLEYQINSTEGSWKEADENETVIPLLKHGDVVNVHLTDGHNAGISAAINIADIIKPTVELNIVLQNLSQIKVEAIAVDNETGIKNYRFHIKEKGQEEDSEGVEQESNLYTYENVEEGKIYELKVIAYDNAGNFKEATKEVTVEPPPNLSKEGPNANVKFIYKNENGEEGWTNGAVNVTVETNVQGYLLRTSKDGINWSNSNTQKLESNDEKIYAILTDGLAYGLPVEESPTNIDKNKPVVNNVEIQENRINIKAGDTESGIAGYAVTTGPKTPIKFNKCEENKEIDITSKTEYKQSGTYYVWIKDKAGNVSDSKSITVNRVPNGSEEGAIIFGEIKWKENKATISVSTEMEYQIQYQINSTEGEWISVEENTIKLENLNHNDVIYARLTDGINVGNYATLIMEDRISPQITKISLQPTYLKERVDIYTIIEAVDGESGIDKEKYKFYIKGIYDDDSTYIEGAKWDSSKAIFENMEIGKTYIVKVLAYDIAGNEVQITREIKTEKH